MSCYVAATPSGDPPLAAIREHVVRAIAVECAASQPDRRYGRTLRQMPWFLVEQPRMQLIAERSCTERERAARVILGDSERQIAEKFGEAART